jgi:linoleoyl-CoA desaturase
MEANKPIRFLPIEKSQFYTVLHARVDAYFAESGLSKHANWQAIIKTVVLTAVYLLPFVSLLILQPGILGAMLLWLAMGVGMAGVGMSIMHDANHGAFSENQRINDWLGYSLFLLGGSVLNWKLQHNNLHHNFTNIVHHDDDIADKPGLRLSPHTELKKIHRFQWFHAIFIYSLVTLYWVTAKDFYQYVRYTRTKVNKNTTIQNRWFLAKIIFLKVAYFFVLIGLPLIAGIPFWQTALGFLLMHATGGIILTVIFQLAHSVEETVYPLPNEKGTVEMDWAIHQMRTTVNFSRNNKLLSWYIGGLNFQVEHHLFPKICHIHYPRIANIVKRTASEFNVPYLEHRSFFHALRSHFYTLKRFGKVPPMDELMG